MATIWDVAKLAGVSKSTVSRIMNNGTSSPAAREAVLDAIKKLNYQPSCFAKNIRTQKSMTIAFMIPDSSNMFYNEMFKAIEEVASKYEYMVILCNTQNNSESEIAYAERLLQRKIDGLIFGTYKMEKQSQDYFINLSKSLPIVFVDNSFKAFEDISVVATEGYSSTRNAVKFLYHKGRRNIAYINFPKDVLVTLPRYEGYLKGLEDCGLPYVPEKIYFPDSKHGLSRRDIGYNGVKQLLESNKDIDAIMVAADTLAIGVIKYLKQHNISIPEQISLVGFDNNQICEIVHPTLTTIAQPISKIGRVAAEILFDKISGKNNLQNRVFFEGTLIQRDST